MRYYTFKNAWINLCCNSGKPQACYETGQLLLIHRRRPFLILFGPPPGFPGRRLVYVVTARVC